MILTNQNLKQELRVLKLLLDEPKTLKYLEKNFHIKAIKRKLTEWVITGDIFMATKLINGQHQNVYSKTQFEKIQQRDAQMDAEFQELAKLLSTPKTRKEIADELPIINLPIKLKRWTAEGKLSVFKDQWAYVYELAIPVTQSNSRIIRGFDTIRVSPRLSRQKNYVSGSTLSGAF